MQVRIFQPTKSSIQSAPKFQHKWVLEFIKPIDAQHKEDLMGRTTSNYTYDQVKLYFNNLNDAINYAKEHQLEYEVIEHVKPIIKPKSYAANFY
ncbi:MAG: ETC complex I subunit [Rickettsiaceae bacterium]|nr:ETC complex I subunit [Rickettsiaceae bacterium]